MVFVWRLWIIDDQWPAQTIRVLGELMRVIPIGTRLIDLKIVNTTSDFQY